MDILKQVKEILVQHDLQEKDHLLGQLDQVLEYHHNLNQAEIAEGVRLLLSAALQEENRTIRETFLSIISTAVGFHDMRKRIDLDQLVVALHSLELEDLELPYALNILGFSGQVSNLPILEKYTHHADAEIRESADDAIDNISTHGEQ